MEFLLIEAALMSEMLKQSVVALPKHLAESLILPVQKDAATNQGRMVRYGLINR